MNRETPTKCEKCGNDFLLTAGGGGYISKWKTYLCQGCQSANHDGFPGQAKWAAWPELRAYLVANDLVFFERDGLLHWRKEALYA